MISKSTMGSSFKGLASYLSDPDKMNWMENRNIANTDIPKIAKEMELTAGLSKRVEKPVYHVSLNWNEFDNPTKDQMIKVADSFLKHMKLEEHQAMIVAHKDKAHPHIHIMVNRIHPEKHKAWENYTYVGTGRDRKIDKGEYQRKEEFLRSTEEQYGWQVTPGKHAGEWNRNFDSKALEIWEVKQGMRIQSKAKQLGMDEIEGQSIQERATGLKDQLYLAKSFNEFDEVLARQNLWIEAKGQGAVITDGTYTKKASSISRGFSGNKLEEKFGQDLKEYVASRNANVDIAEGFKAIDDWATLQERNELEKVKWLTKSQYNRAAGELDKLEKYSKELESVQKEIRGTFTQAFENGKDAYMKFGDHVKKVEFEEAQADLIADPQRFGKVADKGAVVKASDAIGKFNKMQGRYSTQVVNMNKGKRKKRIKTLQAKTGKLSNVANSISRRMMSKGLNETEAGRATNNSVHKIIAVSKAMNTIAKNPSRSPFELAKQAGYSAFSKMDSEAGKTVSNSIMGANKYFKNVAGIIQNPAAGSIKLVKNVLQSAIKQAGKGGRGRGRGI